MGDKVQDAEQSMIKNLEEKTGKSLQDWIKITLESQLEKHKELLDYLKNEHGLTHGYANLVAHKAKQSDAGSAEAGELVDSQYAGKEELRPIYKMLLAEIEKFGTDLEVSPKKAYVSLRRKKQFAIIQPSTKTRLDVGINLKSKAASGRLEASGSFNSMVSHRVRIEDPAQIDKELIAWLREAYEQA